MNFLKNDEYCLLLYFQDLDLKNSWYYAYDACKTVSNGDVK